MCRFAILRTDVPADPAPLLEGFAEMAKKSRTFDGDRQSDGWGVAWLDSNDVWKRYRSLKPVWEDVDVFGRIPPTTRLAMHARSASFADHVGNPDHNQPYLGSNSSYVFNGIFRGARLPAGLDGEIGAQKVWSLIRRFLRSYPPEEALAKTATVLKRVTTDLQAVNVGLVTGDHLYALNLYSRDPAYYRLHTANENGWVCIASEPFASLSFSPSRQDEVVVL